MQWIEVRIWDDLTDYSSKIQVELSGKVPRNKLDALSAHFGEFVNGVDVEYAESLRVGGCPFCGGKDVTGGAVETGIGGNHAGQHMSCDGCQRTWSDNYLLLGFDE